MLLRTRFTLYSLLLALPITTKAQTDSLSPVPATTADTSRTTVISASDTLLLYRLNGRYLGSIWQDLKYTVARPAHWQGKDFIKAGAVFGVAGALLFADRDIKQYITGTNHHGLITTVADKVEPFGNNYSLYLTGGMYLAGVVLHDRRLESGGLMTAKSILISTAIYATIKSIVRRGRPSYYDNPFNFEAPFSNDKQHTSFPSGHSLTIMAFATALAEIYGKDHPWVPWVTYSLAGLTGLSRMYHNRHWSSDVWIGLSLGHFVTKSVFRHHRELERKKAAQFRMQLTTPF